MALADRLDAFSPSNASRAGRKSLVDSPRRYRIGRTSATFGDRRMYGGRIWLVNLARSPPITRLSLIRSPVTSSVPAPVTIFRGRASPLRTTSRRPLSSRSFRNRSTYSSTADSIAILNIFCAPVRIKESRGVSTFSSCSCPFSVIFSRGGVLLPSFNWGSCVFEFHEIGYAAFFISSGFSLIHNFW